MSLSQRRRAALLPQAMGEAGSTVAVESLLARTALKRL
jgi:hypothetical protein